MGECTRALLKGKINPEEIANFILNYYNLKPNEIRIFNLFTNSIKIEDKLKPIKQYGKNTGFWDTDTTHIVFVNPFRKPVPKNSTPTHRSLFWYYSNCVFEGEASTTIASQYETTYISLSHDKEAIEIIKAITAHFGGWMDENDCDDISYREVIPGGSEGKNGEIKPVFYITMEELQEKYGGIVKIVSKEEKKEIDKKRRQTNDSKIS